MQASYEVIAERSRFFLRIIVDSEQLLIKFLQLCEWGGMRTITALMVDIVQYFIF